MIENMKAHATKAMMIINMNLMLLKVIKREACLVPKSFFGFVKGSWTQKGHSKEGGIKRSKGLYEAGNGSVHCKKYERHFTK
jgi:hypothetical protein